MLLPKRLAGTCRNGAERDRGQVYHAVEQATVHGRALCGALPGRRSGGWVAGESATVTCARCRHRMAKQRLSLADQAQPGGA